MKVLINGSSISSGKPVWELDSTTGNFTASQPTWPYRLQEQLNFDMVNLAVAGAGSAYIHESTIAELSQPKLWAAFLDKAHGAKTYFHPKFPHQVKTELIRNNTIAHIIFRVSHIHRNFHQKLVAGSHSYLIPFVL